MRGRSHDIPVVYKHSLVRVILVFKVIIFYVFVANFVGSM